MEEKVQRLKELVKILNAASRAYYQESTEIMSNFEYDRLYDELLVLENETGMILAGSPSIQVGYEVLSELPKEKHESPMLSLDKTKEMETLKNWLQGKEGILSWKMDGLTVVLTYQKGKLFKAVTRGNGEIGEVITNNAKMFKNLPHSIPFTGELVLRGEAVIRYSDFEKINEQIEDIDLKYKNPRNLCSGSVRQLNNEITAQRNVNFFAFGLVTAENMDFKNSREQQYSWLKQQGFAVVEYKKVNEETIIETIHHFANKVSTNDFPSDGLVLLLEDILYGESLGRTSKFPRNAIAFKWADEVKETVLLEVEWSPSRTGLINPVAVFQPVELEGTTVSRASVHNISIMQALELGVGDRIEVYKANMIIPQVAENLTRSGVKDIPQYCPVCGGRTEIRQMNEVQSLYCTNSECEAKKIKAFALLVSRDALNVEGLSESTLEKFVAKGFIKEYADIFRLEKHRDEIVNMEGFGQKSYDNLINSIEKARTTTLAKAIYSLGIPNIGLANAKVICKEFGYEMEAVENATVDMLSAIPGVGGVIAEAFVNYFSDMHHKEQFHDLVAELTIEKTEIRADEQYFKNVNFVITGNVVHFENRNEIKELIETKGGKVTGSVTSKTQYLINNDVYSDSSKNKRAKELGIPIISEEAFLEMLKNSV